MFPEYLIFPSNKTKSTKNDFWSMVALKIVLSYVFSDAEHVCEGFRTIEPTSNIEFDEKGKKSCF